MNGNVTDGAAPIPRGHPAPKGEPPERPDAQVTALLERWQSTGDAAALEQLIAAVLPLVQKGIGSVLRKVNIRDPAATDDAVSLTLDHLRRLPGVQRGDRAVTRFVPRDHAASPGDRADSGTAYIVWLSHERARDVARRWWRSAQHSRAFSQLGRDTVNDLRTRLADALEWNDDSEPLTELIIRLHESIERLQPLEQAVIALLIEGKTQAVIAHVLGVCEGTVSRIRSGAIVRLRALMDPRPPDEAATPHADGGPDAGHPSG